MGRLAARAAPGGEPLIQPDEGTEELEAPPEDERGILTRALDALQAGGGELEDVGFSPAVATEREGGALEAGRRAGETAGEVARGAGRGLSEVGFRTAIGSSELVGADRTAANLRADRELGREFYGESDTPAALAGNIASQLIGEGTQFMVPGVLAGRLGQLAGVSSKGGRFLQLLANPQGAMQRAVQTFLTGAPIDVAISQAGPEESMAGALGALTNDAELIAISQDPVATGAFEVVASFAAGEILGEALQFAAGGARAGTRNLDELGRIVARAEAAGATLPEDVLRQIDELPDDARQTVLEAFGAEQERLENIIREAEAAEAGVARETPETAPETPRAPDAGGRPPEAPDVREAPEEAPPRRETGPEVGRDPDRERILDIDRELEDVAVRPEEAVPGGERPTRAPIEAGERARVTETSPGDEFVDQIRAGEEVEVLAVDDLEGTAEIRITSPTAEGEPFQRVVEVPTDVLEPIGGPRGAEPRPEDVDPTVRQLESEIEAARRGGPAAIGAEHARRLQRHLPDDHPVVQKMAEQFERDPEAAFVTLTGDEAEGALRDFESFLEERAAAEAPAEAGGEVSRRDFLRSVGGFIAATRGTASGTAEVLESLARGQVTPAVNESLVRALDQRIESLRIDIRDMFDEPAPRAGRPDRLEVDQKRMSDLIAIRQSIEEGETPTASQLETLNTIARQAKENRRVVEQSRRFGRLLEEVRDEGGGPDDLLRRVEEEGLDTVDREQIPELFRPIEERLEESRQRIARQRELEEAPEDQRTPWTERTIEPAATGRTQSTLLPGDGTKVETEFAVVEAGDVRASHTPDFTQRTPEEFPPEIQGRAYHGPRGRQAREFTEEMISRFDPDRAFDPTISIAEGPPTITRSGINVAGNGRTIAQQRMYRTQPDRANQLIRDELLERADEFGLDAETIRGMDEPMLVRRIADESVDELDVDALRRINQSSDAPTGKAKDVVSEAASRAGQMRSAEGALRHFADTIPEDATIRSYLETSDGTEFLRRLVDDGVINSAERARFIDATTGSPTAEGKRMVEQIMFAAAIGDPDVLARAPAAALRKMDTALPAIIRADRIEGFEIGETIRDALDLLARSRAEGVKLEDLISQTDFVRPDVEPQVAQMARFLEDAPKNTRGETIGVKDAFRQYADEAEAFARQTESEDLFGFEPRGPEEARGRFAALAPAEAADLRPQEQAAADAFDEAFSEDPVRAARSPKELLEITDQHPAVREAQQRPQPKSGRDTWALHGEDNPTPERAAMRDEWRQTIDENAGWADPAEKPFDGPVARERKAVVILGPPASGKSTVADPMVARFRARLLDSDEVKKLIPEFEDGRGAGAVHEESSFINGREMLPTAIERGENIVWPTIGSKPAKLREQVAMLEEAGYEVHLALNEIPVLEAAKRAWARFLATDRWVPMRYILDIGEKPRTTFDVMKGDPAITSAQRFDNDVPKGTPPILRESLGEPGELRGLRGDRSEALRGGVEGRAPEGEGRGEGELPELPQTRVARQVQTGRGPGSTAHPLSHDLFGEPVREGAEQGSFLDRRGPQGTTEALEDARATVSRLEGKVARGAASSQEQLRYEEARSLVRRLEGQGLDAGEVGARARERGAEQEPDDTGDLFAGQGEPVPLAPGAQAGEQLPSAGRFFDRPEAIDAELVSPVQIIEGLGEALGEALSGLGLKVAAGGIPKGGVFARAVGVFKAGENVIRQIDISDVPVFGHESGHAMHKLFFANTPGSWAKLTDDHFAGLPGAIRGELEDLAVGISDESLKEGWAEVWRRFLDNPKALEAEAPNALRFIEERLEEFPQVREAWQLARDDWTSFRESSAQARVGARVSVGDREPEVLSLEDRWSRARTAILDDMEPVRRVVQAIRDEIGIEGIEEQADDLARLVRGSVGVANHFLEFGTLDFRTLTKRGPAMKEILEPVSENLDEFRRYMVSKRAQELHERDILTGLRDEDVNAVVEQLDAKHGDTFTEAFDRLQDWNQDLLAYLRDAGVISRESFEAIVELNQSYVPFYRVISGEEGAGAGLGANFGHLFSPVQRIKGSGRDIVDPLESMVKNAMTYTHIAQKQQVSRALANLAEKPGVGAVLEKIGTPIKRTQFRFGEVEGKLDEIVPGVDELLEDLRAKRQEEFDRLTEGMSDEEIKNAGIELQDPAEEILSVFRPGDAFGAPNTISVLVDGKRQWYEVDDELFAALQGLNRERLDAFSRMMGVPAKTLRAGATLAPEFLVRNPLRDQVMAFVQSEYGFVPFVDMARGAFELINKGEAYQQWLSAGGYRAALTSLDRKSMQNGLRSMVEEGGVRNVIKHPLDALQALSALMEDASRMGEFLNARAVEGTTKEGLQRSALASREISVDFARHGAKTAALRHISAFWNARLQGYDRLFRAAKKNPARFAAKAFGMITLPSLLEYYSNMDDPDYFELPQWKRDLFWQIKVRDDFIAIPKPFELGLIFGTLPVRVLDSAIGGPGGGGELRDFLTESLGKGEVSGFAPQPTALMPLIENVVNYSFFLRRPIVPRGQEEVRPELQAGPFTSEVAQMLGRWAPGDGISPRKIDNLLFAYTGGLGRIGTELADIPLRAGEPARPSRRVSELPGIRGVADPRPGFGSESVERFYERYEQARIASNSLRFLEQQQQSDAYQAELENEEAARLRSELTMLRNVASQLAELRSTVDAIRRDPDMSGDEKRRRIEELGLQARQMAQSAIGRELPGGG